jgi:hypothetical protein
MQTLKANLTYVNPWRAAVTLGMVAFFIWIPLTGVMKFFQMYDTRPPHDMGPWWWAWVAFPVLGMLVTIVLTVLAAVLFNSVSRVTGGVPYRTSTTSADDDENAGKGHVE